MLDCRSDLFGCKQKHTLTQKPIITLHPLCVTQEADSLPADVTSGNTTVQMWGRFHSHVTEINILLLYNYIFSFQHQWSWRYFAITFSSYLCRTWNFQVSCQFVSVLIKTKTKDMETLYFTSKTLTHKYKITSLVSFINMWRSFYHHFCVRPAVNKRERRINGNWRQNIRKVTFKPEELNIWGVKSKSDV